MIKNSIGVEISTLRKEKGITKLALSDMCGVSLTYISLVEKGAAKPTPEMFNIIFSALLSDEKRMNF